MMANAGPSPEWSDVVDQIKGYFPAVAIVAAMQLDLFTPLADGPKTAEELATALNVQPHRLRLLLRSLAATKLVLLDGERFVNSSLADTFLVRGRSTYMGGSHELYTRQFATVMHTAQSIRAGVPQDPYDWGDMPDEQARAGLRGLNAGATAQGRTVAQSYDFSRFKTILDVGGGGGGFAIGACQMCPDLAVEVIELPRIARICEELVAAAGLESRIRARSHDMAAAALPKMHEAAVLRNLLQVLSPEMARRVVENVSRSLHPGGEIYVLGAILNDDGVSPSGTLALNLFFLNAFQDGEAYTESQYRAWLEAAGFVDITRTIFRGGLDLSLMMGRKPR